MGLLDSDNMEYFKNKLFGYTEPEQGEVVEYSNNPDRIYKKHHNIQFGNMNKSYWDMLREGNFAGPFRQNFPLERPDGFDDRLVGYHKKAYGENFFDIKKYREEWDKDRWF